MRGLVGLMLLLCASSSWAEWVYIARWESGVTYYDPTTIRLRGNMRRAWLLLDRDAVGPSGELSQMDLFEYDCTEERVRLLAARFYANHMGNGSTVEEMPESLNWVYIAPRTPGEAVLKLLCKQ